MSSCAEAKRRLAVSKPTSVTSKSSKVVVWATSFRFAVQSPVQPLVPPLGVPMVAKYPKFRGKSYEDPDAHAKKFDKTYEIKNAPPVVLQHKEFVFESMLTGKASKWLAKFPSDHFQTYNVVETAFFWHFKIEKTVAQNLEKLRILKHGKWTVEEYAACLGFCSAVGSNRSTSYSKSLE